MKTLLYILTFPSGKSYIGITTRTVRRRISLHVNHSKSRDNAVHRAIRKYGRDAIFARILAVGHKGFILDLEKKAIAAFGTLVPNGYNQTDGGEPGYAMIYTAERRAEISAAMKGKNLGNKFALGYRHTKEAREKISSAGRGRLISNDGRAKISASKLGNNYATGRIVTEIARRSSSEKQRGRPKTDEAKAKMSAAKKGRPWTEARRAALTRGR